MMLKNENSDSGIITATCNKESIVSLPTLQVIITKEKCNIDKYENMFAGESLDFSFKGYSYKDNIKEAAEEILNQIGSLVVDNVLQRLKNNTIDNLYENSVPINNKKWNAYLNLLRIERIKNSLNTIKKILEIENNKILENIENIESHHSYSIDSIVESAA